MSFVADASGFARRLCEAEAERSGLSMREAAATVARRLRCSTNAIAALLYQPPKSVCADLFASLQAAVETQIEREIEALENELLRLRAGRIRRSPIEISEMAADLARLKSRMQGQGSLL
jgi:alkylhydroperoxidase family enzyme